MPDAAARTSRLSVSADDLAALEARKFEPNDIAGVAQHPGHGVGRDHSCNDAAQYTSIAARVFAWIIFCWPLRHIGRWQHNASSAQLKQIFDEYGAQPISVALILRGPKSSALHSPSRSSSDELKQP